MRNRITLGLVAASMLALAAMGSATGLTASSAAAGTPVVAVAASRPAVAASARRTPYWLSQVGDVTLYRPAGPVRGVVLFLSGDAGWNLGVVDMARALTREGVAVAGFSTPVFLKAMESGSGKCINPNFALTALAQDVEHKLGLPHYVTPILAGYSSGATVTYGALALAPRGIYAGGVSLGFGPDIDGHKPWCTTPGFAPTVITKPAAGWLLPPMVQLPAPWLVLQGMTDEVVSPETARRFTAGIPQAKLIELPKVGHGFAVEANWMPQFSAAFAPLLKPATGPAMAGPAKTTDDLPLTLVTNPRAPASDLMAVMYSGDGGWAGLDRDLADQLAARGVPVVGVDSLQYFWNAKSQAQAGSDAGRIIAHYSAIWRRPKVVLIGYSFGADTLPFIVHNLPADQRSQVARVSLMGLDTSADFQFHLSSWLDVSGDNSLPTLPAIERLRGTPLQCLSGADEADSACPGLSAGSVQHIVLPGGHHFDGNARLLATSIIAGLK